MTKSIHIISESQNACFSLGTSIIFPNYFITDNFFYYYIHTIYTLISCNNEITFIKMLIFLEVCTKMNEVNKKLYINFLFISISFFSKEETLLFNLLFQRLSYDIFS